MEKLYVKQIGVQNGIDERLIAGGVKMSEADEMYEGIECIILGMLKNYKNQETYTDREWYIREGAIEALENLLEKLNE